MSVSLQNCRVCCLFGNIWRFSFCTLSQYPPYSSGLNYLEQLDAVLCSLYSAGGIFSLLCVLRFHSDAHISWHFRGVRGETDAEEGCILFATPLLCSPERNRLYDSTVCSKLSFKAHLSVLRIFSTCQLIWDTPLQMSYFPTVHLNKTRIKYPLWGRRVTLQRYKGKQDRVPVSKQLWVKWEMLTDKRKTGTLLKSYAAELGTCTWEEVMFQRVFYFYSPLFPLSIQPTPFPSLVLLAAIDNVYTCVLLFV